MKHFTFEMSFDDFAKQYKTKCTCKSKIPSEHRMSCAYNEIHRQWRFEGTNRYTFIKAEEAARLAKGN